MSVTVARNVKPPVLNSTRRSALDASTYVKIDVVLKDLRTYSRRLTVVASSIKDELQLLERLYYKGRNQHRAALFWRKVAEMRRFGQRVSEMQLPSLTESLRYSFFGDGAQRNPKTLKGSWTQVPGSESVGFLLERSRAACQLADTARRRFEGIYQSFTLLMQTGAFLQLALTLTAIVSRLDILMYEFRAVVGNLASVADQLLSALNPAHGPRVIAPLQAPHDKNMRAASNDLTLEIVPSSEVFAEEMFDEDLGSSVARTVIDATEEFHSNPFASTSALRVDIPDPVSTAIASAAQVAGNVESPETASGSLSRGADAVKAMMAMTRIKNVTKTTQPAGDNISSGTDLSARKRKKAINNVQGVTSKKRKKKDEIDDIFGSL